MQRDEHEHPRKGLRGQLRAPMRSAMSGQKARTIVRDVGVGKQRAERRHVHRLPVARFDAPLLESLDHLLGDPLAIGAAEQGPELARAGTRPPSRQAHREGRGTRPRARIAPQEPPLRGHFGGNFGEATSARDHPRKSQ